MIYRQDPEDLENFILEYTEYLRQKEITKNYKQIYLYTVLKKLIGNRFSR